MIKIEDMQHNIGLEADILEDCVATLAGGPSLTPMATVGDKLARMAKRMRERESGTRA